MIDWIDSEMVLWLAEEMQSNLETLLLEAGGLGVDIVGRLMMVVGAWEEERRSKKIIILYEMCFDFVGQHNLVAFFHGSQWGT